MNSIVAQARLNSKEIKLEAMRQKKKMVIKKSGVVKMCMEMHMMRIIMHG